VEFGPTHIFTQIYAPDNRRLLKVTRIIEWFWSLDDIGHGNIRYAILSHCQIMQFLVMQRCNKFQTGTERRAVPLRQPSLLLALPSRTSVFRVNAGSRTTSS